MVNKFTLALVISLLSSVSAHAAKPALTGCAASTLTTSQAGYVSCLGAFSGNMDNQLTGSNGIFAKISTGFGITTGTFYSSENFSAASNPFAQNEGARDDGVINFDKALTGSFVLGLKQGDGFSLYKFDGSKVIGGISAIKYDTLGVFTSPTGGTGLSHAGFFGTPVAAVPEPETYAMLLAGLGLIATIARRRKSKQA